MLRKFSTHKKGGIFKAASNYVTAVVPCDSFTRWVGISYLRPPTQGRLNYLQGEIQLSGFLQLRFSFRFVRIWSAFSAAFGGDTDSKKILSMAKLKTQRLCQFETAVCRKKYQKACTNYTILEYMICLDEFEVT